ncbi:hypothetical protein AEO54_085 [Vibrio phage vB_VorS-PVo5]|nr:hypothetical protein AEO54_085 [Vibrio phage vB_VorS-PVo5]
MQKYPKGTLVEVIKHEYRTDLIGKRFVVDVTKLGHLRIGRGANKERILKNVLLYKTPFFSILPDSYNNNVWFTEDYLKPVGDIFPEDEGFEFDESKPVWAPKLVVEDGGALVI